MDLNNIDDMLEVDEECQTYWKTLIQRIRETDGSLNTIRNLIFEVLTGEELQYMYSIWGVTLDQYIEHLSNKAKEVPDEPK